MFDPSQFIEKFKEEASERLQRLNEGYIALETQIADEKIFDELMREAHTLKGSSRMVGLTDISELSHILEDIFISISRGELKPEGEVSEAVFTILDAILEMTEQGKNDERLKNHVLKMADKVLKNKKSSKEKGGKNEKEIKVAKDHDLENRQRAEIKEDIKNRENLNENAELRKHEMSTIRIKASHIDEMLNTIGETVILINRMSDLVSKIKDTARKMKTLREIWNMASDSLREKADDKFLLEQIRSIDATINSMTVDSSALYSVIEDISKMELFVNTLHEKTMEMRMLPASYILNLFPRAVRDMATEFGKEIELTIEGEDTQMDKHVLEEIYDPLIHILRNAVDHGIETVEERISAGKPKQGHIGISVRQEGDSIVISITDDGRGIDPVRIREVAVKKGIITEAEASSISDKEAIYLIFKPGFSSKEETSQTSGRGIGMDVVKKHIEDNLKGHIEIETEKGKGTEFILTIPITLAIIRSLLIGVRDHIFAIPTSNIQEAIIARNEDIVYSNGERFLKLRGDYIPYVSMAELLGLKGISEGNIALILSVAGKTYAYEIDQILGEQPVVIKPLGSAMKNLKIFAGATILASGEIVLIINTNEMVRMTKEITLYARSYEKSDNKKRFNRKPRILVVEDSLTTREFEVNLLKSAGYEVEGARNGLEAIDILKKKAFDLVITDIQMPQMDGYELIRRIKSDERLRSIPTIVISSLGSEKDKIAGMKAGADAYISKQDFQKGNLISLINRFIAFN